MAANLSRKLKITPPSSQEEWSMRERLILASSVVRSGDQNWVSVSRTVKPIAESGFGFRPRAPDFFSQKSCASQYSDMLEKVSTPKRKRTSEGGGTETPGEQIVRTLTYERINELKKMIKNDQIKYRRSKVEIEMIMNGKCDDQLPKFLEGLQRPKSTEMPGFVKAPQIPQTIAQTSSSVVASTQQPLKSPVPLSPKKHKNLRVPKPTERFKEFQQEQQARHGHSSPSPSHAPQQQHFPNQQQYQQLHQTLEMQHLQQKMQQQQQQQQLEQQKLMRVEQHLVKTSQKTPEHPSLQDQVKVAKPRQPSPRQFFRSENTPEMMLQQPEQHQTHQQIFARLSDTSQSFLAQLVQSANSEHNVKQENAAMDVDVSFEKQTKQIPKAKESSTTFESIIDHAALNHGPAPLSSHLSASSGLLSTLLSAPVKEIKQVAKIMNQTSTDQDQNEHIQRDQSSESGVPFLDVANPVTDVSKVESVREKKPGIALSASEVAPTLSKLLVTSTSGSGTASTHNETISVQKNEGAVLQHGGQGMFEEDCLTKKNTSTLVSKAIKEEASRRRKSCEEAGVKENTEQEAGARLSIVMTPKALVEDIGKPKTEKRRPGRPRTRKPPKEIEYLEDETEDEIVKETVKPEFTINIDPDLEECDSEERFKKHDDHEDLKKEDFSIQCSYGSESVPDSPASQISQSGSDDTVDSVQAQKTWKKSIMLVWRAAANHKYANVFLHPVTDDEAPGYHNLIYRPMDLSTIKKNIESGMIRTTKGFQRDMMLMFQNALMYNSSDHDVYRMAEEMREDVMDQITSYIATQLMVQSDRESKMLRGHKSDVFHFSL